MMSSVEGAAASAQGADERPVSSANDDSSTSQPFASLQMDVGLVDSYLLRLLLPRLVAMMKHFHPGLRISTDGLTTLLHLVTVWFTSTQTPASKALGMSVREDGERNSNGGVTRYSTFKLVLLSILMPAVYQHLVSWYQLSSHYTVTDQISQLSLERKRKVVGGIVNAVQKVVPVLRLVALLSFWSGRSNTPGLAMRLVGLSFAQGEEQQAPPFNATYAHRRWLYEELLRTVQSISPYSRSTFSSLHSWLRESLPTLWKMRRSADDAARCVICRSSPISIPYVTNCGHLYCYPCLWNAQLDDPCFRCRRCRQRVCSSRPIESFSRGSKLKKN